MFTGIIATTGEVVRRAGPPHNRRAGAVLTVRPRRPFRGVSLGESVSVDGVCLTVEDLSGGNLAFRLLPETLRVSSLGVLAKGSLVNLERSLRAGDRIGGHLLWGHVDGCGVVERRRSNRGSVTLQIRTPAELSRLLVPKGPIAVDGVSLTLDAEVEPARFRVHLVRHTLAVTTLGRKQAGDRVNLEVDPIVKYLHRVL